MPTNLFEQTKPEAMDAVAKLLGFTSVDAGFRMTLRRLPPLPEGFTVGDLTVAFLKAKLAEFEK